MKKTPTDIYAVPASTGKKAGGQVTLTSLKDEPASILGYMTADRVISILRAAEGGDMTDLWTLYRDLVSGHSHLQGEASKRVLAVVGQRRNIKPASKDPGDQAAAVMITEALNALPRMTQALSHLLLSFLYPVTVVEKVYAPSSAGAIGRYSLTALIPVPPRLLDFKTGVLRIVDTDPATGRSLYTTHEVDEARYIVHRSSLFSIPDTFGGAFRSILWWCMLSLMDRTWWSKFLERYGAPFLVGRYDADDDQSRTILESAFSFATKIGGLVVTKETEVEIKAAAAADTGEAYSAFLSVCNREISKLILGQTLSSDAQSTGLGSGVAAMQEQVRQDIRDFDNASLAETLRDQVFTQYLRINGSAAKAPMISWGSMTIDETKARADLLSSLDDIGVELSDDGIADLAADSALKLQRKASASIPVRRPLHALAAAGDGRTPETVIAANDQVARTGAAELAQAFRGRHAEIPRLIALSTSAEDCINRIQLYLSDRPPAEVADVLERAMAVHSANALIQAREIDPSALS